METIRPNKRTGVFPTAPRNQVFSLELGNGSRFDILLHVYERGIFVAIERYGAYTFNTFGGGDYISEKLNLPLGDAMGVAAFLRDQMS